MKRYVKKYTRLTQHKGRNREATDEDAVQRNGDEEKIKVAIVSLSDAVPDPRTVMIKSLYREIQQDIKHLQYIPIYMQHLYIQICIMHGCAMLPDAAYSTC